MIPNASIRSYWEKTRNQSKRVMARIPLGTASRPNPLQPCRSSKNLMMRMAPWAVHQGMSTFYTLSDAFLSDWIYSPANPASERRNWKLTLENIVTTTTIYHFVTKTGSLLVSRPSQSRSLGYRSPHLLLP
ncbi:unnamed protein product [Caenorhabditis auriculariae]|uniref:Uncharacterized protein n=1 Tax=Caenorhabditis auriculariae TaxID=2777116 RepID=A0A8S1HUH1_9PELO|nr:unnamed protein product [Caenorhabditis auriculariae]